MRIPWVENVKGLRSNDLFWAAVIAAVSLIVRFMHLIRLPPQGAELRNSDILAMSPLGRALPLHATLEFALGTSPPPFGSLLVALNVLLGGLTCSLVYLLAHDVYGRRWFGIVAGLILAFQPWHIYYSLHPTPEVLSGLLVALSTRSMVRRRLTAFALTSSAAILSTFEAWIAVALEMLVMCKEALQREGRRVSFLALPLGLMLFLVFGLRHTTADPLMSCRGILGVGGFTFYFESLFLATFFLFFLGLVFAALKNSASRLTSGVAVGYVLFLSLLAGAGCETPGASRLITIMPLVSVMIAAVMPKFRGGILRRILVFTAFLFVLAVPYLAQVSIFG